MNLFDRLLGRHPDPTTDWGAFRLPIPDFDVATMRFGALRFGDAIEAAAFLGRPDTLQWPQAEYCELLYARGGFQIDFDRGKFAYAAFLLGPDAFLPKHEALRFSQPRIVGCTPDALCLSHDTDRKILERLFGSPASVDADDRETILYYSRQEITMEFEMDGHTGRLKRWNLYPT